MIIKQSIRKESLNSIQFHMTIKFSLLFTIGIKKMRNQKVYMYQNFHNIFVFLMKEFRSYLKSLLKRKGSRLLMGLAKSQWV